MDISKATRCLLCTVLSLTLLTGCASLFSHSSETIAFTSEPAGQTVVVDGASYRTPAQVTLGTDKSHTATFPNGKTYMIKRGLNGWFIANVLFLPGFVVDVITGDMNNDLYPSHMEYRNGEVYSGVKLIKSEDKPVPKHP